MEQVSIIGCGNMGRALIQTLANHGIQVKIWNRTPAKAQALVQANVSVADSLAAAVSASPVIIFSLSDPGYEAATALLRTSKDNLAGKIIVQLSTGEMETSKQLQELITGAGGKYLDGAVFVDPAIVGTPKGLFIYGGELATFETVKPVLEHFGKAVFVGEQLEFIGMLEFTLNVAAIPMEIGLLQGRKLCQSGGVPVELYDSLVHTFMTNHAARVLEWMPELTDPTILKSGTTVNLLAQGTQQILDYIKTTDIDASLFEAILKLYAGGVASGRGDHDSLCVAELHAANDN